jgi:hypothetical protein
MTTRDPKVAKVLGYPRDRLGNLYGPEKFDSDHLPSSEQVRRSHSPGWVERRLAKAQKSREEREALLARLRLSPDTTIHRCSRNPGVRNPPIRPDMIFGKDRRSRVSSGMLYKNKNRTCGQEGSGLWGDSDRATLPIAVPLTVFRPRCMSAFGGLSGHASSAS